MNVSLCLRKGVYTNFRLHALLTSAPDGRERSASGCGMVEWKGSCIPNYSRYRMRTCQPHRPEGLSRDETTHPRLGSSQIWYGSDNIRGSQTLPNVRPDSPFLIDSGLSDVPENRDCPAFSLLTRLPGKFQPVHCYNLLCIYNTYFYYFQLIRFLFQFIPINT